MPAFPVSVKWGRETYKDVDVNTDDDPMVFKAQLYALTGVLPERQKIMVKGKTLGESWDSFPIAPKVPVLLMGSKEEDISRPPPEKIKFMEDMNETELASAMELPLGLQNLGNTCYMNATIQCLKTVPPLTQSLKKFSGGVGQEENAVAITAALRDLYNAMDKGMSLPPIILLQTLHNAFPRFAERGEGNVFQQQDANELWTEVVRMLQQKLPAEESGKKYDSVIDEYFGGKFSVEMKCDEAEAEDVIKSEEKFLQLSCFISEDTKYMQSGMVSKLVEKITKNSPSLNKDALYTKTSKVDRLPAYLTVQMVRFYYKERSATNAKMLRDVKFPLSFDAYDLCTKRLQDKLLPMREKFKEIDDAEAAKKMSLEEKEKNKSKTGQVIPFQFADDPGSNNSGLYELQAVLTHKGRTSNSGHYVAWIKHKDDVWIMCDDDNVNPVTSEDILKLSGGGDWHIAYVLLYGPKVLVLPEGQTMEPVRCEVTSEAEKMSTD